MSIREQDEFCLAPQSFASIHLLKRGEGGGGAVVVFFPLSSHLLLLISLSLKGDLSVRDVFVTQVGGGREH